MPVTVRWSPSPITSPAQGLFFYRTLCYPLHSVVVTFSEHRFDLPLGLAVHDALQSLVLASAHAGMMTDNRKSAIGR